MSIESAFFCVGGRWWVGGLGGLASISGTRDAAGGAESGAFDARVKGSCIAINHNCLSELPQVSSGLLSWDSPVTGVSVRAMRDVTLSGWAARRSKCSLNRYANSQSLWVNA